MNSARPLVSVITPVLDQGEFVEACLRSVMDQTYPHVEHLVQDGGSRDGTLEVLQRYSGRYDLRCESGSDDGQADAINRGLERARGEIVCWLNADDLFFAPQVLERVVAVFERHPGVGLVVGDGYRADRQGRLVAPIVLDPEALNLRRLRQADFILQPSAFWRRNALRLDAGYRYAFDWLFFLQLLEGGAELYYLREYLSIYRFYGTNKTARDEAARKRELLRLARRNLGRWDPNTLWAAGVYAGYRLAEATRQRWLKALVRKANALVASATRYRVGTG